MTRKLPWDWLPLALILAGFFVLHLFDIQSLDVWFHLRTGEHVLDTGAWPRADPFSYTSTQLWVAHEWLSGVLYALVFRACGLPGLVVFNALLYTTTLAVLLLVCLYARPRRVWATPAVWVVPTLLVLASALTFRALLRVFIRPDGFMLLFVATFLLVIANSRRSGPRVLFVLPLLQLAWANVHGGGSVVGMAIVTLLFLGEVAWRRGRSADGRPRIVAMVGGLTVVAWFLNPYGWRVPAYFLNAFGDQSREILEWRHTGAGDLVGAFGVVLVLAAVGVAMRFRRLHAADLLIAGFLCALGLRHMRLIPVALIGLVPLACWPLWQALTWARRRGGRRFRKASRTVVPLACVVTVLAVCGWTVVTQTRTFGSCYRFGVGINENFFPVEAVRFVRENRIQGPMFNAFGFGGYLMWANPAERVFIDGRVDAYGEPFVARYRAFPQKTVWDSMEREYGFNYVIVDNEPTYVCETLDNSTNWTLVQWDDRALVYVRNTAGNADVIRRFAFRKLRPNNRDFSYMLRWLDAPSDREATLRELTRSVEESPSNVNAHLMRAWFCEHVAEGGTPQAPEVTDAALQALQDYDALLAILPQRADLWRHRGIALSRLQRFDEARRSLEAATRLAPNDFESHHRLSVACYMLGDREAALRECRAALAINPSSAAAARNLQTFMSTAPSSSNGPARPGPGRP